METLKIEMNRQIFWDFSNNQGFNIVSLILNEYDKYPNYIRNNKESKECMQPE